VANTLNSFSNGAVGFVVWLDGAVARKEGRLIIRQAVAKKIAMNLSDFASSCWINADVEGSRGYGLWERHFEAAREMLFPLAQNLLSTSRLLAANTFRAARNRLARIRLISCADEYV
jgi:hypothetical protein